MTSIRSTTDAPVDVLTRARFSVLDRLRIRLRPAPFIPAMGAGAAIAAEQGLPLVIGDLRDQPAGEQSVDRLPGPVAGREASPRSPRSALATGFRRFSIRYNLGGLPVVAATGRSGSSTVH
ncbi:hypothetical protein [Streptomyces bluensis]|uniref:hypothetical protein n=1 Tax=Streptomyces bluensis TaxID=33897 RepID=UPI00332E5791